MIDLIKCLYIWSTFGNEGKYIVHLPSYFQRNMYFVQTNKHVTGYSVNTTDRFSFMIHVDISFTSIKRVVVDKKLTQMH